MWRTGWWGHDFLQAPAVQSRLTGIRPSASFSTVASTPSGSRQGGGWETITGVKKIDRAHTQLTHSLTPRSKLSSRACLWNCRGGWWPPRRSSERNPQETTKPARLPQNSCCHSHLTDGIIFTPGKLKTHHPEECCLRQGLVLVDGGEDAEDQTGQNHEEPAGRRIQQTLTLIH